MKNALKLVWWLMAVPVFGQVVQPGGGTSGNATAVNGAAVPASAACLGSNSSSQLIAASCSGSGGTGTVTTFSSGAFTPLFTTSVANPTTTPALTFTPVTQTANLVFAGPASGSAAAPSFRSLVSLDIPNNAANTTGQAGTVATISGLIAAGSNVTLAGAGTSASPYTISSTAAGGGGGTVTTFSAGNLAPLFTSSVANATSTPSLTFALTSQTANTFLSAPNGSSGVPTFRVIAPADIPVATTSAFGAVKPDGTTITIASGVISAAGASVPAATQVLGSNGTSLIATGTSGNPFTSTLYTANIYSSGGFQVGHIYSLNGTDGLDFTGATLNSANIFQAPAYVQSATTSAIASASTLAPTVGISHVSGTTPIATITPLAGMASGVGGIITLIADGAWTTTTGGNINAAITAVVGQAYTFTYDGSKWYVNN